MKKIKSYLFASLLVIFTCNLFSEVEKRIFEPEIKSRLEISFLSNSYSNFSYSENYNDKEYDFALSSWKKFKESLKIFLLSKEDDKSFFSYKNTSQKYSGIAFQVFTGYDFVNFNQNSDDHYSFVYNGINFHGFISDNIQFYGKWWSGHYSGNNNLAKVHSELVDSWTQNSDDQNTTYLDNLNGRIEYESSIGSFSIGRDKFNVGNSISGSVILSDNCNEYGYFSALFPIGDFSISLLHASLIPDSSYYDMGLDDLPYKTFDNKFLVMHKLDWQPSEKFHLFLGEEVVYGSRSIDPSYLIPHTFYRVTEHNLADRDNVLIFLGGTWKNSNISLYSNFIFDELKKSEVFGDWWGNKYAFQIGSSYKFADDNRFGLEFTAVRPWMYTHKAIPNKFSHDKIGLGFPEGSNLVQFDSELNLKLEESIFLDFHGFLKKQGSLGNDFSINYNSRPKDTAKWLEGEKSKTLATDAVITWKIRKHWNLKLGYQYRKCEKEKIKDSLYFSFQARY